MPFQEANETELYYEARGDGPPLLLIMGASGYGGGFGRLAEFLADEFTVVSYDRRGNGRSPRPANWNATSPEEQADDAAALLAGLGLAPVAIFGTSSAGIFALAAVIRRPESVRGAVLHEPALFSLFDDPEGVRETLVALIGEAMEAGGPAAAFERFIRFAAGDATGSTWIRASRRGCSRARIPISASRAVPSTLTFPTKRRLPRSPRRSSYS